MNLFSFLEKGFCPIYVILVWLYRKHISFENISLFQEANILLLPENMILFLLVKRTRSPFFVPCMSDLSCFTESTAVLKISGFIRRQIFENITLFQETNILLFWKT
jgi:hypothetical protein